MLDLNRTVQLVRGALFDAEATWRAYLPEAGDWQKTAILLTGPLIVVSAVIAYLLGFLGSDSMFGAFRPTIVSTLLGIVMMAISAGVVAFIISALAGMFGGKSSFALGLAASTLAFVPGYAGQALSGLPWLGGLLALVLFIWSLVQLWRIIPLYLDVPASKRAPHYIVSLIACIVVMFILGAVANRVMYGSIGGPAMNDFSGISSRSSEDAASGMFGGVMSQMMGGMTQVAGLQTAELEVVKAGGGNWAEHQWVRESLRTAFF